MPLQCDINTFSWCTKLLLHNTEGQIRRGILTLYWRTYAVSKGTMISGHFFSTGNHFVKTVFTNLVYKTGLVYKLGLQKTKEDTCLFLVFVFFFFKVEKAPNNRSSDCELHPDDFSSLAGRNFLGKTVTVVL